MRPDLRSQRRPNLSELARVIRRNEGARSRSSGVAFGLLLGVVMVWGCTFGLVKGAL